MAASPRVSAGSSPSLRLSPVYRTLDNCSVETRGLCPVQLAKPSMEGSAMLIDCGACNNASGSAWSKRQGADLITFRRRPAETIDTASAG